MKKVFVDILLKLFGSGITLILHDTLVLDRWLWVRKYLNYYQNKNSLKLLDVGCGSGAMTIASAKMGFNSLGLSWDLDNNNKAINLNKEASGAINANLNFDSYFTQIILN